MSLGVGPGQVCGEMRPGKSSDGHERDVVVGRRHQGFPVDVRTVGVLQMDVETGLARQSRQHVLQQQQGGGKSVGHFIDV